MQPTLLRAGSVCGVPAKSASNRTDETRTDCTPCLVKVRPRCYHLDMAVSKISVALDPDVAEAASESARRSGMSLSAWLNRAAEYALAVEDGLLAVFEWENEHGTLTADELHDAEAVLDG